MTNGDLEGRTNTTIETLSILIVDNDEGILDVTKEMLLKINPEFKVDCKKTIESDLKKYDIIITNRMPSENLNAIKGIPVIYTSCLYLEDERVLLREHGEKFYTRLPKPFRKNELKSVLDKYFPKNNA